MQEERAAIQIPILVASRGSSLATIARAVGAQSRLQGKRRPGAWEHLAAAEVRVSAAGRVQWIDARYTEG
jgi:hypothetical protein